MAKKLGDIKSELESLIQGEVVDNASELDRYSHDASLFEVKPQLVVYPVSGEDMAKLVEFVAKHKQQFPDLSLTARSGGTDMSGGAINDSIIVDVNRHINDIGEVKGDKITTQPGAYYRDFEAKTLKEDLLMPSYPASREICTVGGMAANNSGGEKSLRYGKTQDYITRIKMILRDGKEYVFEPLTKAELDEKLTNDDLQADIYRQLFDLVTNNREVINDTRPKVSKNSSGYNLWDVWDGEVFNPVKVIVGSQGTFGLITEVTYKLVPAQPLSGMVVLFMPSMKQLGEIINTVLPFNPTTMESFDKHTIKFAFRFFLSFRKTLGWKNFVMLGLSFIPVLNKLLSYLPSLPELILMVEFEGEDRQEIEAKITELKKQLSVFDVKARLVHDRKHEEKFWIMRRESFNLLRKNVKDKHTAPFIDDLVVPPEHLPEFLPKLNLILEKYDLLYTIAGHMGDGNFHIIPLMDLSEKSERDKIHPLLEEVTDLVISYDGSLSGEHNDGMVRGPILERMFGSDYTRLLKETKRIFDPDNIFNPHKKTDATWEYSSSHIRRGF